MLTFIQILGQADPTGLAIIGFMLKVFFIGMTILMFIIGLLPILLLIFLIYKLVIHFKRDECKNCKKRIPHTSIYCSYCGTKVE